MSSIPASGIGISSLRTEWSVARTWAAATGSCSCVVIGRTWTSLQATSSCYVGISALPVYFVLYCSEGPLQDRATLLNLVTELGDGPDEGGRPISIAITGGTEFRGVTVTQPTFALHLHDHAHLYELTCHRTLLILFAITAAFHHHLTEPPQASNRWLSAMNFLRGGWEGFILALLLCWLNVCFFPAVGGLVGCRDFLVE